MHWCGWICVADASVIAQYARVRSEDLLLRHRPGAPLVLVHGGRGDADQWAFSLDALAVSHRVIALDLLGFGRSDKPPIDYRIAGFVELLDDFCLQSASRVRRCSGIHWADGSSRRSPYRFLTVFTGWFSTMPRASTRDHAR